MAEGLCAVHGVLRGEKVDDGVVDGEDDEGLHDGCDEQGLRGSAALLDLEKPDPEEADADGSNAGDGAAEEEEDQEGHENVIDGKSLGGLDEDPVDGLEDVDVSEDVAAVGLADRVGGLVDGGDEHGDPEDY